MTQVGSRKVKVMIGSPDAGFSGSNGSVMARDSSYSGNRSLLVEIEPRTLPPAS